MAAWGNGTALNNTTSKTRRDSRPSFSNFSTKENFSSCCVTTFTFPWLPSHCFQNIYIQPHICGCLCLITLSSFRSHILARPWGRRTGRKKTLRLGQAKAGWGPKPWTRGTHVEQWPSRLCAKQQAHWRLSSSFRSTSCSVLQRCIESLILSPDRSRLTPFPCLCQNKQIVELQKDGHLESC